MEIKKQSDQVIILGKGASMYSAKGVMDKFEDNIPVWTLNDGVPIRMSRLENLHFDIHSPRHHQDEEIWKKFKTNVKGFEKENLQIVTSENYPLKEIVDYFRVNFLFNTIAYEIALALYLKYKTIYLFGVDLFLNQEIGVKERLSVEFWLGIAKGKQVKVLRSTRGSSLFKNPTQEYVDNFNYGVTAGMHKEVPARYLSDDNLYI